MSSDCECSIDNSEFEEYERKAFFSEPFGQEIPFSEFIAIPYIATIKLLILALRFRRILPVIRIYINKEA